MPEIQVSQINTHYLPLLSQQSAWPLVQVFSKHSDHLSTVVKLFSPSDSNFPISFENT